MKNTMSYQKLLNEGITVIECDDIRKEPDVLLHCFDDFILTLKTNNQSVIYANPILITECDLINIHNLSFAAEECAPDAIYNLEEFLSDNNQVSNAIKKQIEERNKEIINYQGKPYMIEFGAFINGIYFQFVDDNIIQNDFRFNNTEFIERILFFNQEAINSFCDEKDRQAKAEKTEMERKRSVELEQFKQMLISNEEFANCTNQEKRKIFLLEHEKEFCLTYPSLYEMLYTPYSHGMFSSSVSAYGKNYLDKVYGDMKGKILSK